MKSDVDSAAIIALLVDHVPLAEIARRLDIPRTTLRRKIKEEQLDDRVGREIESRFNRAASYRAQAAERVLAKAERAACGEWIPTETQLELIKYFIGWDAPDTPVQAETQRPLIVQLFQNTEEVIEVPR